MMAILMDFPLKGSSLYLGSMYVKFSYIWLILMVNVGRYTVPHMHSIWKSSWNLLMYLHDFKKSLFGIKGRVQPPCYQLEQ